MDEIRAEAQVIFKSTPEMYEKEKSGVKTNTLRKIDEQDSRFKLLRLGCRLIFIQNKETGEEFGRRITDYTEWDGYAIISWQHDDNIVDVGMYVKETKEKLAQRIASGDFLSQFRKYMNNKLDEPIDDEVNDYFTNEELLKEFQKFILHKFG